MDPTSGTGWTVGGYEVENRVTGWFGLGIEETSVLYLFLYKPVKYIELTTKPIYRKYLECSWASGQDGGLLMSCTIIPDVVQEILVPDGFI